MYSQELFALRTELKQEKDLMEYFCGWVVLSAS